MDANGEWQDIETGSSSNSNDDNGTAADCEVFVVTFAADEQIPEIIRANKTAAEIAAAVAAHKLVFGQYGQLHGYLNLNDNSGAYTVEYSYFELFEFDIFNVQLIPNTMSFDTEHSTQDNEYWTFNQGDPIQIQTGDNNSGSET